MNYSLTLNHEKSNHVVARLALSGKTPIQIALELGRKRDSVRRQLSRLRAAGWPIPAYDNLGRILQDRKIQITLPSKSYCDLASAAAKRGLDVEALIASLLDTAARENLIGAILDE